MTMPYGRDCCAAAPIQVLAAVTVIQIDALGTLDRGILVQRLAVKNTAHRGSGFDLGRFGR
jgi:hypothetical protein